MAGIRSGGLSFRKRRKKVSLTGAKQVVLLVVESIIVLVIAFALVYCVGMKVTVVGNSMSSRLVDGNQVLVDRLSYSLTDPKAGDVVVFLPNGNEKSHYYVKRIVGVPGDTVQIEDGVLLVNGELFDDENTAAIQNAGVAEEPVTLGEDEYFVLGDNRNSSEDSRYASVGNVKKDYIIGKAWLRVSPLKEIGLVK